MAHRKASDSYQPLRHTDIIDSMVHRKTSGCVCRARPPTSNRSVENQVPNRAMPYKRVSKGNALPKEVMAAC